MTLIVDGGGVTGGGPIDGCVDCCGGLDFGNVLSGLIGGLVTEVHGCEFFFGEVPELVDLEGEGITLVGFDEFKIVGENFESISFHFIFVLTVECGFPFFPLGDELLFHNPVGGDGVGGGLVHGNEHG